MFTSMKKICFAIGLLPFAACAASDDDDSSSTQGVDTEGASATNPSTSSPTSNPSTSTTDDTMTGTSDDPTTGETDDPTTGGPGGLGQCDTVCSTFMDCCEAAGVPADNCMEDGIGGYVCEDTECYVLGCADDMECQDLFMNDAYACNNDTGGCYIPCESLDDCEMVVAGFYDTCDPELGCTTTPDPFDCNETDCPVGVCDTETGACVECLEDADCEGSDYGPYCDTEINLCACMSDEDCAFELDACE